MSAPAAAATEVPVLRPLRWWDVERVLPLERLLFPDDPWSAELFWSELGQGATRHYVLAERAGEVVGYAGLAAPAGDGDVQTLAVAPAAQGRGVGGLLLRELLREAGARGCAAVLLEVRADNRPALALYARHGFERVGVRRGYYAGGVDAVVMRRRRPA
ncbi:ribosomal protein S18-alanine N-acetyltransferase [Vallicoccus soli]|uniref:Ribosomal-protein-alanine N-acetyltransferase n=1 Tax=Vallicoccus soli TaxID=2339232 RepID=A0A3A3YS32_9ACTN|nr:ribosomal protein S18-alanine N-acetyltransferase [Vallicoccus soli]RJK93488.1 ribosomal-protein-alanine N-acetyltransferase [Vallicoccus soli]